MAEKNSGKVQDEPDGVLNAYARRTTWHGLHYVFTSGYWTFRRAIWALVVILHILMFFYWTYEIMVVFLAYPVKTDISVVEKESITLPVVTICPLNPLRLTSLSDAGTYSSIATSYQTSSNWGEAVARAGQNLTAVATTAGPVLTDLVISCKVAGTDCINGTANTNKWTSVLTAAGQCYSLTTQLDQRAPGAQGGLILTLNSQAYETTYDIGGSPGVKVIVHSSNDRPLLAQDSFDVSPGFKAITQVSLKEYLRLPAPYSVCQTKAGAMTNKACRLECLKSMTESACGCVPFYNAGSGDTVCSTSAAMTCEQDVANKFLSTGNTGVGVCNCEITCSEQEWSVQTTFSQMMEAAISRQLSSGTKAALTTAFNNAKTASTNTGAPGLPTSLSYSDNIVSLEVFFTNLRYTSVTHKAAYSFMEHTKDHMISVLVLFGASVMSFWELIDLFIVAIVRCCGRGQKTTAPYKAGP